MQESALHPGEAHPWPVLDAATAAEILQVPISTLECWCDEGLPQRADGYFDPLPLVNWATWHHLDHCRALARRWRLFHDWFTGEASLRPRTIRWNRIHRLYLPQPPTRLEWWIPTADSLPGQHVLADDGLTVSDLTSARIPGFYHLSGSPTSVPIEARGAVTVGLEVATILPDDSVEHAQLVDAVAAVAERFTYGYRFHEPGEFPAADSAQERWDGTCLDCAMTLAARFTRERRPWRLVSGIIAHTAIANPHYWLECETSAGWTPVDPTIPTVLRMLRRDWRGALSRSVGVRDSSRITLAIDPQGLPNLPGGPSCRSTGGEAIAVINQQTYNAFSCIDWVCAECSAEFSAP